MWSICKRSTDTVPSNPIEFPEPLGMAHSQTRKTLPVLGVEIRSWYFHQLIMRKIKACGHHGKENLSHNLFRLLRRLAKTSKQSFLEKEWKIYLHGLGWWSSPKKLHKRKSNNLEWILTVQNKLFCWHYSYSIYISPAKNSFSNNCIFAK